ncbi:MAG: UDP-glucose-beta-D-glucan glucosyltransferase, partial [Cyanobacteriota bacterium]|nr:UDP-glucose-beta-D-glucan glucosyltransferase [Cyanobacteriota bacterium]
MKADNGRVSPGAWAFLLLSAGLLLSAVVLSSSGSGWLDGQVLNPLSLRTLPRQFQVADLWRDALPPVVAAGVAAVCSLWLPRRPWSYALMEGVLLVVALRYFAWRATTLNTAHPLSLVCSVLLFAAELTYLITAGLQLLPALQYDPSLRSRQADQLQ